MADLRIRQVIECIAERLGQPIPLDEPAKLSHCINIIRVNHAESLLKNSICNITEALENCAFCDMYYSAAYLPR